VEGSLIFISYRRGESAGYAGRLHESLERRFGDGRVFRDVDELEAGQDFVDAISARLRDCAACLVMIGSEWVDVTDQSGRRRLEQTNDYVRLEIEAAITRSDLLVVPVLVEGATMPSAESLPASIQALSRRHALSLRDETWDADVDRLATTLEKRIGSRTLAGEIRQVSRMPRLLPRKLIAWLALGAALPAAAMLLWRGNDAPDRQTAISSVSPDAGVGVRTTAPARAIALPRLAEAANGSLIYTVLSGDITPGGDTSFLRLRIRLSNEGSYPTNFWDHSFRFAASGQIVAATGGLNTLVDGHTIKQEVIAFELPAGTARGTLQLVAQNVIAEIPLDLTTTDAPSGVDKVDAGDALSRAQVARVTTDAVPLAKGQDFSYTLERLVARRFVNTLRVIATIRVSNHGPYPWYFGPDAIRIAIDGQPLIASTWPDVLVPGVSAMTGDFVFDTPPSTARITLRVAAPQAEMAFDLSPVAR
jgi:TIR domain